MDILTYGALLNKVKEAKPTDEQVAQAVEEWLDDHPEATTTVQDGAISYAKLNSSLKGTVDDVSNLKTDFSQLEEGVCLEETQTGDYHVITPDDNYLSVSANQSVIVGNKNMVPVATNDVVGQEYTVGDITRVRNADDSYTYSGIASRAHTYTYVNNFADLPAGKYTLSGCPSNNLSLRLNADYFLNGTRKNLARDTGSSGTGTLSQGGTNLAVYFEIPNGTDLTTPITVKPQLERGETATEYVKCENHSVSANTNIPIEDTTYIFASSSFGLKTLKIDISEIRNRLDDVEGDISGFDDVFTDIDNRIDAANADIAVCEAETLKPYPQNNIPAAQMITFTDGAEHVPVTSMVVNLDYSETARTKLRAFVSSENIFNLDDVITKNNITKNPDGSISPPGANLTTSIYTGKYNTSAAVPAEDMDRLPYLPAGRYYITTSDDWIFVGTVDPSDGSVTTVLIDNAHGFTLESDSLINICIRNTVTYIMLTSEPHDAYIKNPGKTYVVPFVDTEETAFTMYGGTVDLINGIATELYDSSGDELITPVVHNIAPVAVKSCLGYNHIWSDCDSVAVTYRADVKMYVDQRNKSDALEQYNIDASQFGNIRLDMLMQPGANVVAIAHRGLSHDYPENTMPAFKGAATAGFLVVETDIQWTSDGIPVLCHNATINHTGRNADGTEIEDTIYIKDLTYDELMEYDFGIWKGEQFAGTKMPTFDEFILFCKQAGLHPMIELKDYQQTMEQTMTIIQKIINVGMIDKVAWTSNFKDLLLQILSVHQGANVNLIASSLSESRWNDLLEIKAKYPAVNISVGCGIDYMDADERAAAIARLKSVNVPMGMWTIDNSATIKNLDPYITIITSNMLNAGTVLREAALND